MYTRSSSASRSLPLRLSSSSLQLIAVAIASAVACSWCCRVDRCFFLVLPSLSSLSCNTELAFVARDSLPQSYSAAAAMALLRQAPTATRPSSLARASGRGPGPSSAGGHAALQLGAHRRPRLCSRLHDRCRHPAQSMVAGRGASARWGTPTRAATEPHRSWRRCQASRRRLSGCLARRPCADGPAASSPLV